MPMRHGFRLFACAIFFAIGCSEVKDDQLINIYAREYLDTPKYLFKRGEPRIVRDSLLLYSDWRGTVRRHEWQKPVIGDGKWTEFTSYGNAIYMLGGNYGLSPMVGDALIVPLYMSGDSSKIDTDFDGGSYWNKVH